jgi:hypothetical protein
MRKHGDLERGSASVAQAGLAALVALLLLAALADAAAGGKVEAGRGLGAAIGRSLACGHPLVPAYGWPLARLARSLSPAAVASPAMSRPERTG